MGNSCAGDEHIDRVSLLKDIYTTTRMIENDPGPESIRRGTRRRVSYSHCLTGFRISREQGHHEPVDRLDQWIGELHLFSPASTFWPERGVVSTTDLVARPKVSCNSQISTTSVKDRKQEMLSEQAVSMINEETSLKIKEQPKMVNMPRQVEWTNLELYEPVENDTTQE